jgi:excisionase family DNA binding protein
MALTTETSGSSSRALMTAEEVAERLGGVSVKWVWAQTRAGMIPHVRLGRLLRYRPEKIDSWLAEIERGGE